MNAPSPPDTASRTTAAVRRSRWPGWIWAVPLAALLLIGWWGFRVVTEGGKTITISFDDVHGMKQGSTTVVYRGMTVGKVRGIVLAKDGGSVDVTVHIDDSATKFLTSGTQFWLRGANPSLSKPSSLASVLAGPTIVMEPGPGTPAKYFHGLAREPVFSGAPSAPQTYEVSLNGDAGALKPGQPVKLRGFTVGEVKDVGFRYDARSGEITTPVMLELYPSLFHIDGAAGANAATEFAAAIDRLIGEGMRARLERDPPLIGDPQVALDIEPGSGGATPATMNGIPQIPAAPQTGINTIVNRIDKVPIDQIARNLLDTTHHLDALVSSPQIADAITQLDAALKQIRETADKAGPKVAKLTESLRRTATRLDETAKTANGVLGGSTSQTGTQQALREITNAARSVRELADYLDRHPEALVEGRSGE